MTEKDYRILNAILEYEVKADCSNVDEVADYAEDFIEQNDLMAELARELDIPGLHYATGLIGEFESQFEYKDRLIHVRFRRALRGEYTMVTVEDDKYMYGKYAIGAYGEFFDAGVIEMRPTPEETLLDAVTRNDKFALYAIKTVKDKTIETVSRAIAHLSLINVED